MTSAVGDFDLSAFADEVVDALDGIEPRWRDGFEEEQVFSWLFDSWPLPTHWSCDPASVAHYCLVAMDHVLCVVTKRPARPERDLLPTGRIPQSAPTRARGAKN